MTRRSRRDGGASLVEAAFALPVLFMFIMALIDLGMWSFNSNQATNAARDGARAGVITYVGADVKTSATYAGILAAVEQHLDRDLVSDQVDVSCVTPAGALVVGGCAAADLDTDRLRVEVSWDWKLITPIAGIIGADSGAARGDATMTIVGQPVWGGVPITPGPEPEPQPEPEPDPDPTEDCHITELSVTDPASADKHGRVADIDITYKTNGADRCEGLTVQLTTPAPGGTVVSAVCENCLVSQDHIWNYTGPTGNEGKVWDAGQATVTVFNEWVTGVSKQFNVTRAS